MTALYARQKSLRSVDWSSIGRIVFSALGLRALPITQILNLCFGADKAMQAIALRMADDIDAP